MNNTRKYEHSRPEPRAEPAVDWTPIIKSIEEWFNDLDSEGYAEYDDLDHYLAERITEAIYGPAVWDYVNERLR